MFSVYKNKLQCKIKSFTNKSVVKQIFIPSENDRKGWTCRFGRVPRSGRCKAKRAKKEETGHGFEVQKSWL